MRRFASILLVLVACPSPAAYAQQGTPERSSAAPLTLPEALDLLRTRNASLLSGRAHVDATRASEITAGLRPNPVFTSSNEDFNVFNPTRFDIVGAQEFTQNFSQLFERGGKRSARVESARWTTTLTREQLLDTQRQLELNLKTAFVSLVLAKSTLELARQDLDDYQKVIALNEVRLKAGEISPVELDRIRSHEADFEGDVLNARLSVVQARSTIQALLGISNPSTPLDVAGTLDYPVLPLTLDALQRAALENRPDYLAARAGITKASADVSLAAANGATDFVLGAEFKRNNFDNTVGFTFSIPLRVFDRNQGEKERTRLELEASRSNEQAARAQVVADVSQAYETYQLALERARIYSPEYLERARNVRDRTEFSYRQRATTLLDFLDALHTYRSIEMAWRSANAAVLTALHQLSWATSTEILK